MYLLRMSGKTTKCVDKENNSQGVDDMKRDACVIFRADAGKSIGYGHVMRCLSLAQALREMRVHCTFASSDSVPKDTVTKQGFQFTSLDSGEGDMLGELDQLSQLADKLHPCLIVVDSYRVTDKYLRSVRKLASLVYIDDVKAFPYPCDVLVNYNIYGAQWTADYQKEQNPFSSRLLLGTQYAPLRQEFAACPRRAIAQDVKKVLVSTGGADCQDMTRRILDLLRRNSQFADIEFHFLVGALNPYRTQIEAVAAKMENVKLHIQENNISKLMQTCDVAISAAGSTLYELCACGTPTITYILADNQIPGAKAFAEKKLMLLAGDCQDEQFGRRLLKCMVELIGSCKMRKDMSARMQDEVDGLGAGRLAKELLGIPIEKMPRADC